MMEDPAFYDRALRRLDLFGIVLAALLVTVLAIWSGWRDGLGAALGAAFALGSYRNWKRVAAAAGGEKRSRPGLGLILRSALLVAAMVVIIKYFGVSAWSVLAGLSVSVAAVVIEIVYQLVFT